MTVIHTFSPEYTALINAFNFFLCPNYFIKMAIYTITIVTVIDNA